MHNLFCFKEPAGSFIVRPGKRAGIYAISIKFVLIQLHYVCPDCDYFILFYPKESSMHLFSFLHNNRTMVMIKPANEVIIYLLFCFSLPFFICILSVHYVDWSDGMIILTLKSPPATPRPRQVHVRSTYQVCCLFFMFFGV